MQESIRVKVKAGIRGLFVCSEGFGIGVVFWFVLWLKSVYQLFYIIFFICQVLLLFFCYLRALEFYEIGSVKFPSS